MAIELAPDVEKLRDLSEVLMAMEVGDQANWSEYHFLKVPAGWMATIVNVDADRKRTLSTCFIPEPPATWWITAGLKKRKRKE